MVSPIPYASFKTTQVTLHPYQVVLIVLAAVAAIVFEPGISLICLSLGLRRLGAGAGDGPAVVY